MARNFHIDIDLLDNDILNVGTMAVDILSENTLGAGVTADGVELKDGAVTVTSDFNIIGDGGIGFHVGAAESFFLHSNTGVRELILDPGVPFEADTILVDTMTERTLANGILAEGVLLKDGAVTVTSDFNIIGDGGIGFHVGTVGKEFFLHSNTGDKELLLDAGVPFEADTILVDTMNERTLNNGMAVEGVHFEDSAISSVESLLVSVSDTFLVPQIKIDQAGTGDAGLELSAGGQSFSMIIDNSALDILSIGTGSGGGFVPGLMMRVVGRNIGIGTTTAIPPGYALHLRGNSGSTTPFFTIDQDSSGDCSMQYLLTGGQNYSSGIDNSLSGDPWIFAANTGVLGKLEAGTTVYTISSTPDFTFNVAVDMGTNTFFVDTMAESTLDAGITAEGVLLKDGLVDGVDIANECLLDTLADAKGDILAATAADVIARLAVGTDGQMLTADSAEATGLKWAGGALFTAGITFEVNKYTSAHTITTADFFVFMDTTLGALTATLPASAVNGETYIIKNIGAANKKVTVDPNGNNIDGSASNRTLKSMDSEGYTSDGTDWSVTL